MSETHQHPVRYTVIMRDRHWWGGHVTLIIIGIGSSKKDDELLIFEEGGGFHSINYARVWRLSAAPLEHQHEG